MQNDNSPEIIKKRSSVLIRWVHRISALITAPFILTSVVIALALTHVQAVNEFSRSILPSKPIPNVRLAEPIKSGSWEQALKLANLAMQSDGKVITTARPNEVVIQGFGKRSHDIQHAKQNSNMRVYVDTTNMTITRMEDRENSLVLKAHAMHGFRLFNMRYLSLSVMTTLGLTIAFVTGMMLYTGKGSYQGKGLSKWHYTLGVWSSAFLVIMIITTLMMEFSLFSGFGNKKDASHEIPAISLNVPKQLGSLDQGREVVKLAIGTMPKAAFIRDNGNSVKFSEVGDGIGGKSVYVNINKQEILKITDWRNDMQAFMFIIHDGRFLGGMNKFNIYDLGALILAFEIISGLIIFAKQASKKKTIPLS